MCPRAKLQRRQHLRLRPHLPDAGQAGRLRLSSSQPDFECVVSARRLQVAGVRASAREPVEPRALPLADVAIRLAVASAGARAVSRAHSGARHADPGIELPSTAHVPPIFAVHRFRTLEIRDTTAKAAARIGDVPRTPSSAGFSSATGTSGSAAVSTASMASRAGRTSASTRRARTSRSTGAARTRVAICRGICTTSAATERCEDGQTDGDAQRGAGAQPSSTLILFHSCPSAARRIVCNPTARV